MHYELKQRKLLQNRRTKRTRFTAGTNQYKDSISGETSHLQTRCRERLFKRRVTNVTKFRRAAERFRGTMNE